MILFDPMYFLVVGPGFLLAMWASWQTKTQFSRYSQVRSHRGFTGAQAAQHLLDGAGIRDVRIEPVAGQLTDHYDPSSKTLRLSESVYQSQSIAALGVACHEAGHAIQDATNYAGLTIRSLLVRPAMIGSSLGVWVFFGGMLLMAFAGQIGFPIAFAGLLLFGATLLFQLVTLPVEFDASNRAKQLIVESGIIYPEEREGVDRVLNAAALTYVAAAATTALTLLYYAWVLFGRGQSDE